ncbi:MAG: hypothetical protein LBH25_10270 [Fibromonadaceae bacterium]|jgi:hypothetical protein|nr:hypothetical protein [Fibromonadaceae bacterium]
MKFSRCVLLLLFAASFAFAAVERIGIPVSPSLWDPYLPNPAHPSYASNLGSLQEGRITLGFQNSDLAHLSLSVPGLQIISANTRWNIAPEHPRWDYIPKYAHLAEEGYYRDFFLIAGGSRLSNILPVKNWDLGLGATFKSLAVENEDSAKLWAAAWLGASVSLSVNSLLISGAWDGYEQRYLLGFAEPNSWQAGMEFYQSYDDFSSFGLQPGTELFFYDNIKVHGGMRWQFARSSNNRQIKRQEFMINFGTGVRFRPWRRSTDPEWLRPILSPLDAAVFYDWEISFDSNIDVGYKVYNWLFSLSKWF